MKRSAQNLIEFVFIIPLLIIILFGILEFALFYRNVSVVEDIATEASVAASRKFVPDSMNSNSYSNVNFNSAVKAAAETVRKRGGSLGVSTLTFSYTDLGSPFGTRPYALYQIDSAETRTINSVVTPIVSLLVDYRTPEQDGIIVQLIYQYRTLLVGAQLPVLGGPPVVLIPRDIPISSSKIQQYIVY